MKEYQLDPTGMNEMKQGFCVKRDWRFDTLTISLGVSAEVTCLGQKTSYVQDLRKCRAIGKSMVGNMIDWKHVVLF